MCIVNRPQRMPTICKKWNGEINPRMADTSFSPQDEKDQLISDASVIARNLSRRSMGSQELIKGHIAILSLDKDEDHRTLMAIPEVEDRIEQGCKRIGERQLEGRNAQPC